MGGPRLRGGGGGGGGGGSGEMCSGGICGLEMGAATSESC